MVYGLWNGFVCQVIDLVPTSEESESQPSQSQVPESQSQVPESESQEGSPNDEGWDSDNDEDWNNEDHGWDPNDLELIPTAVEEKRDSDNERSNAPVDEGPLPLDAYKPTPAPKTKKISNCVCGNSFQTTSVARLKQIEHMVEKTVKCPKCETECTDECEIIHCTMSHSKFHKASIWFCKKCAVVSF